MLRACSRGPGCSVCWKAPSTPAASRPYSCSRSSSGRSAQPRAGRRLLLGAPARPGDSASVSVGASSTPAASVQTCGTGRSRRVRAGGWAPSTRAPARPTFLPRAPRAPRRPHPVPRAPHPEPHPDLDPEPAGGPRAACACACAGQAAALRVASACEPTVPAPPPPLLSHRPRARGPEPNSARAGVPAAPSPARRAPGHQPGAGSLPPVARTHQRPHVPGDAVGTVTPSRALGTAGRGTEPGLEEGPRPEMAPPPTPRVCLDARGQLRQVWGTDRALGEETFLVTKSSPRTQQATREKGTQQPSRVLFCRTTFS